LNKKPPRRKEDTLSGKLAPAIFQVKIMAHLKNVVLACVVLAST